ncbi:MOSC domain-containing protein [Paracoccus sediminicola]|uniref:MOSC domain-containing protein n=1 Tax=Paracoccus sediminicola TaxID=3017783 RepID=UPI0022EFF911|nr:MOSC N-terminal beta barrel domain-containing protein [Paracoccus sediminicola]WBU55748.1 MOSC domain-containing protein [Paracoccus sediminicola]
MARLSQIWRYPVKAIGRQRLDRVRLERGGKLPFDRHWAVMHEAALDKLDENGELTQWLPKSAFLRGAASPALQAISGGYDDGKLRLDHPDAGAITVDPCSDEDRAAFLKWLSPLWPEGKGAPAALVSGPAALTDTKKPFISINSLDSLSALESKVGERLGVERWRGNLWLEGLEPFAEQDWIGREIRIGPARLVIREPIGRCAATAVDTATGEPDRDMVRALSEQYGKGDFGVYAEVLEGGELAELAEVVVGDTLDESEAAPDADHEA